MTFRKGHRRIFGVLLAIFLLAGALVPTGLALAIDEAGTGTPAPSAPSPTPAASSTADSPEPSAPADGGESLEMPDPTAGDAASQPPTPETPTPAPTESVDPSEMPTPTETIVPTESPAPTETTLPTETPVPTETTLPTETPVPTESPLPTLTPAPALAVTATETGFTISGEMGEAGELTLQLDGAALRAEMLTGLPEGASATAENGALLVSLPAGAFCTDADPGVGRGGGNAGPDGATLEPDRLRDAGKARARGGGAGNLARADRCAGLAGRGAPRGGGLSDPEAPPRARRRRTPGTHGGRPLAAGSFGAARNSGGRRPLFDLAGSGGAAGARARGRRGAHRGLDAPARRAGGLAADGGGRRLDVHCGELPRGGNHRV